MKNLIALIIIGLVIILMPACSTTSTIYNGHYTYKQIRKAGYDCKPFKGKKYFRATSDLLKANVVKL